MKPEIVVVDIDGVLIDWSPHHLYRRLIPDDEARAALFARLPLDAMILEGDRNGSLRAEVEALAERHPEEAALIMRWWAGWERMCAGLFAETVALQDALRKAGVPVWALSNFATDAWERALRLHPELGDFDGLVISGHERLVKPDPALYERLERRAPRSFSSTTRTTTSPPPGRGAGADMCMRALRKPAPHWRPRGFPV